MQGLELVVVLGVAVLVCSLVARRYIQADGRQTTVAFGWPGSTSKRYGSPAVRQSSESFSHR
jgi:hypothetical protein